MDPRRAGARTGKTSRPSRPSLDLDGTRASAPVGRHDEQQHQPTRAAGQVCLVSSYLFAGSQAGRAGRQGRQSQSRRLEMGSGPMASPDPSIDPRYPTPAPPVPPSSAPFSALDLGTWPAGTTVRLYGAPTYAVHATTWLGEANPISFPLLIYTGTSVTIHHPPSTIQLPPPAVLLYLQLHTPQHHPDSPPSFPGPSLT